jgi:hypothetical protein
MKSSVTTNNANGLLTCIFDKFIDCIYRNISSELHQRMRTDEAICEVAVVWQINAVH